MLQFRIQSTPNPNARKYVLSEEVKATGKISYKSSKECLHVPLAAELFSIAGVKQIHFFENVITVTQDGQKEWGDIDTKVQDIVYKNILHHDVYFDEETTKENKPKSYDETNVELTKIDEILDRTIRSSLQMDGGDVELVELVGKILFLRYLGACGGCPSSTQGTLMAMTSILQDEYDPDLEISIVEAK